jgi:hypothetical protein
MAKIEVQRQFPGKSPTEMYEAACMAYKTCGYSIWKERPIAWLVLAKRTTDKGEVDTNFSARPGASTVLTLVIQCNGYTEAELNGMAEELFAAVNKTL